jgi:hypothetical protein
MLEFPAFRRFFPDKQLTDEFLDLIKAMIKYLERSSTVSHIMLINYPSLALELDGWEATLENNPEPFLGILISSLFSQDCFSLAATTLFNKGRQCSVSEMDLCKGIPPRFSSSLQCASLA